jgi:hypothetical protein
MTIFRLGDRVKGESRDGEKYTGKIIEIQDEKVVVCLRFKSNNYLFDRWSCNKKPNGEYGSDLYYGLLEKNKKGKIEKLKEKLIGNTQGKKVG